MPNDTRMNVVRRNYDAMRTNAGTKTLTADIKNKLKKQSSSFYREYLKVFFSGANNFHVLFFCCLMFCLTAGAQKFTLNGYIKDSVTGETLIGANLNIPSVGKGVTS